MYCKILPLYIKSPFAFHATLLNNASNNYIDVTNSLQFIGHSSIIIVNLFCNGIGLDLQKIRFSCPKSLLPLSSRVTAYVSSCFGLGRISTFPGGPMRQSDARRNFRGYHGRAADDIFMHWRDPHFPSR